LPRFTSSYINFQIVTHFALQFSHIVHFDTYSATFFPENTHQHVFIPAFFTWNILKHLHCFLLQSGPDIGWKLSHSLVLKSNISHFFFSKSVLVSFCWKF